MFGWFSRKPSIRLDLAKDRNAFIALIAAAVTAFNKARPKDLKPITRVDIRFDLTSEAYPRVWLELDDAPGAGPYTSDVQRFRIMERVCKHWAPSCHAVMDGKPITVVASDRSTVESDETSLCGAAGLFFVDLMNSLRKAGVFKPLPRAPKCYLGVSTNDGEFGWPDDEKRGPDNMV